jgi:hypothetical protein
MGHSAEKAQQKNSEGRHKKGAPFAQANRRTLAIRQNPR